jgi:hypothetical protein
LSTVVADLTDLLDALGSKSVVERAIGTTEMINAIGTKTTRELVFGSPDRASTWAMSLIALAEGV